jgi:hypothetical protein
MMPLSKVRTSAAFLAPLPSPDPSTDDLLRLVTSGDHEGGQPKEDPTGRRSMARDDLPYKVELWNEPGSAVEQVIAVTANASIGYAAYYAATREYPDRHITLRHKNSVVARWRGPKH